MRKIVVVENLTLDGVMQAPGGADEDRRGGFEHAAAIAGAENAAERDFLRRRRRKLH
jgi:hypothetical protein